MNQITITLTDTQREALADLFLSLAVAFSPLKVGPPANVAYAIPPTAEPEPIARPVEAVAPPEPAPVVADKPKRKAAPCFRDPAKRAEAYGTRKTAHGVAMLWKGCGLYREAMFQKESGNPAFTDVTGTIDGGTYTVWLTDLQRQIVKGIIARRVKQ